MSDKTSVIALRQWAIDANTVFTGWTGTTYTATKDAQLKEMFRRFGLLMTNLADLVEGTRYGE